ncbi:murein biosynthesis integral membrane protein MurJ [Nocardioides panacisoli]|uniref:murein biosynthesis integral membrane protein MurJ n=1 Tax=Nocardioides panacisoli TaxID=627624 RepID=UPI001C639CB4|nr:murein biosynthesis integral membrane protein MurJ [Nocardioides panacisoli]QYJ03296.1 murein biosynthesis integral membrane protein MurJ [Nocardioides panacisoli]
MTERSILASSAVMAAGTIFSRASGLIRSMLLAAALGLGLHADIFQVANTVPNMLYILLAGGVFNAVLVPQLVRAMKNDADGGASYVDRIMTLAICFLGAVTILLVVAAPWVMDLLLSNRYDDPALAEQRDSAIDFARFCLPQVFFYGMFVLVGQVLNARGRFGPMMWAPIANNVIAVAILVVYLFVFGAATTEEQTGPFSTSQEALLGIGSTVGIVAQFLILLPYLRAAGISFHPRFDFRDTGLGHTLRLGAWTLGFVLVNQAAYVVTVRLASGGTAEAADGTGLTIYSGAMMVVMVPHSVITVSLATAVLPRLSRLAEAGDHAALARTLTDAIRTALVVMVAFAALLPVVAEPVAQVVWGRGAAAETYVRAVPALTIFGVAFVFFTLHYLTLRGFYAMEQTRTVFWVQCIIAACNVSVAVVLVGRTAPEQTAAMLVTAYATAYAVGSMVSFGLLSRRLGEFRARDHGAYLLRLAACAVVAAGVAWLLSGPVADLRADLPGADTWWWGGVEAAALGGVGLVAFVAVAKLVALRELTVVLDGVTARLRRG